MPLSDRVKLTIHELRMQMLGTQVLFGFQLQSTFKEGFAHLSRTARGVDALALTSIVLALAALVAAPVQHCLIERGDASKRLLSAASRLAACALACLAVALACDAFIVTEYRYGAPLAWTAAALTLAAGLAVWFGLGLWLRRSPHSPMNAAADDPPAPAVESTALHEKIKQLLTESRIVLPGLQGIAGFQLVITLSFAFDELPASAQNIHFFALFTILLSILLVIAPAPVHRLAYKGVDDAHFHRIGSRLLMAALLPFALGISADFYVAAGRMVGYGVAVAAAAVSVFAMLVSAWFIVPLRIRARSPRQVRAARSGTPHAYRGPRRSTEI